MLYLLWYHSGPSSIFMFLFCFVVMVLKPDTNGARDHSWRGTLVTLWLTICLSPMHYLFFFLPKMRMERVGLRICHIKTNKPWTGLIKITMSKREIVQNMRSQRREARCAVSEWTPSHRTPRPAQNQGAFLLDLSPDWITPLLLHSFFLLWACRDSALHSQENSLLFDFFVTWALAYNLMEFEGFSLTPQPVWDCHHTRHQSSSTSPLPERPSALAHNPGPPFLFRMYDGFLLDLEASFALFLKAHICLEVLLLHLKETIQ